MLPSGTPAPGGGAQSVASSLLRTNSGMMGGAAQAGSVQSQTPFSLVSPRNQYNTNSMLGNISNVSSLLNNHSFGRGGIAGAEQDPLAFTNPSDHTQSQQQFTIPQGGIGSVKLESGEQNGQQQQLQALRGLGQVKVEPQHSDQSMFLHQQQQQQHNQQQFLQLSRQNSQVAAALQHQRMLQQHQQNQQHQQHQQQILKNMPQQRTQQLHQNSIPMRVQGKPPYEPGTGARRLTQYMCHQRHRPEDNNIEFWRKFIGEFFAPNGKKRWCVSMYGSGRQTTGVFPQDVWHCEICNRKPVRGFETTVEVLPRLCQIKYASGTVEELLYVDMPREYHNASGQIVLDYNKAIQESVFDQLRVVRDGQLRIIFNQDLKISSWEFCASHHEELIPRRLLIPQVTQIGTVVQKFQAANQNAPAGLSTQDLRTTCNSFVSSARQLAKALEVPLVNDLGYTKRYVRCLQISEVVNSMKDLIDYSRETGTGPIDSLNNFPRRTSASTGAPQQLQQQGQQSMPQNTNHHDQGSVHAPMQHPPPSNGVVTLNNPLSVVSSTSTPSTAALLHQNSMNSRQENRMSALNTPYGGANSNSNTAQIPSTSSPSSLPAPHPNPSSPFPAPTQSGSHNPMPNSHGADPNDSQSSVQQILQEIMSSQIKGINGNSPAINGGPGNGGMGFGSMDGLGPSGSVNGIRGAMTNNTMAMNGRVGINSLSQDPTGMNHQLLGGFGSVNGFNNLHFDWKSSP